VSGVVVPKVPGTVSPLPIAPPVPAISVIGKVTGAKVAVTGQLPVTAPVVYVMAEVETLVPV